MTADKMMSIEEVKFRYRLSQSTGLSGLCSLCYPELVDAIDKAWQEANQKGDSSFWPGNWVMFDADIKFLEGLKSRLI